MPLSDLQTKQASDLVERAVDAAGFLRSAGPADIPWGDATTTQKTTILAKAKNDLVKGAATAFFNPVALGAGRDALNLKIVAMDWSGKEYWFKYYLAETTDMSVLTEPEKKKLHAIVKRLIYKSKGGVAPEHELKMTLNQVPLPEFKQMLRDLLEMGFVKVPCTDKQLVEDSFADMVAPKVNGVRSVMKVYSAGPTKKDPSKDKRWKIRFRCDTRGYSDIAAKGGFHAKARNDLAYASQIGLQNPWHPCSDPAVNQYMWFRKGAKDNCLNTVVSVGTSTDWMTYLPFPLLNDMPRGYTTTKRFFRFDGGKSDSVELPVHYCWLYLFVMADLVAFKTGRFAHDKYNAEEFGEIGVGSVPIGNIYGAVKFARVFHGAAPKGGLTAPIGKKLDEAGFSAYPVESVGPPQTKFAYSKIFPEPAGIVEIRRVFEEMRKPVVRHLRWSSSGFEDVPAAFDTPSGKIKEINPTMFMGL